MKNSRISKIIEPILPSLISIGVGLLVGGLILLISKPSSAFSGFITLLRGPIGNAPLRNLGNMFYYATPIMLTGLSVGFAFKTGLFNIGASGQFFSGSLAAVLVGIKAEFIPVEYRWILALVAAFLVGAIVAGIGGVLKAYFNVNEVITSIMFNYITMYVVIHLIRVFDIYNVLRNETITVPTRVPKMGLDKIFTNSFIGGGALIAIVVAIIVYVIIEKTTFGYELKAVGYNRDAAKYAGINEKRSIILSMFIAGGLSGLAGGVHYLVGSSRHISLEYTIPVEGFNGIPVALLANSHPIGIIFSSLFIGYLRINSQTIQTLGYVPEVVDMVIAIILYATALSAMFVNLRGRFKKKSKKDTEEVVS